MIKDCILVSDMLIERSLLLQPSAVSFEQGTKPQPSAFPKAVPMYQFT